MIKTMNKQQQRLVLENLDYAKQLAWQFGSTITGDMFEKCITINDLMQDSTEGLIEAAMRWDASSSVSFRTLAYIWCKKYVLRAIRKFGSPLSVPDNHKGGVELLHLDAKNNENSAIEDRILYMMAVAEDSEQEASSEMKERISHAVRELSKKERIVITCFYLLGDDMKICHKTLQELGVKPSRIYQIKNHALRKLEFLLTVKNFQLTVNS